ncbi:MAG: peptidylprolyl isomerase [Calditrichia bacterium]
MISSRTIKSTFVIALVGIFSATAFFACGDAEKATPLATVGPHTITDKQFRNRLVDFLYTVGMDDNARLRDQILNNMVSEYLIADFADEQGIGELPAFKNSFDYRRKYAIVKAWREQTVENVPDVTDDDIRTAFARMNETLRARHLFAETKEKADSLYRLLQAGASFEQLAMQNFSDPKLAISGGDLGNFSASQMDPAFEDAAYALKIGEISEPVQTDAGYSIIRLDNRTKRPIVTENEYANKKHYVRRYLIWKRKELAKRDYLNSVAAENPIKYNEAGLERVVNIVIQQMLADNDSDVGPLAFDRELVNEVDINCLIAGDINWSVADVLLQLGQIKNKQARLIKNTHGLKVVLRGLVARSVFYEQAIAAGFDEKLSVRNSIASAERLHKTRFVQQAIFDTLRLRPSELQEEYRKNKDEYYTAEMVKVQVLLLDDSTRAVELRNSKTDFGTLVKQYSMRPDREKSNGILDWYNRAAFGKIADPIFALERGEVSMPLERDGFFYLVKMLERRPRQQLSFEEAQERLNAKLLPEKQVRVFKSFIENLRSARKVDVNRQLLSEVSLIET